MNNESESIRSDTLMVDTRSHDSELRRSRTAAQRAWELVDFGSHYIPGGDGRLAEWGLGRTYNYADQIYG